MVQCRPAIFSRSPFLALGQEKIEVESHAHRGRSLSAVRFHDVYSTKLLRQSRRISHHCNYGKM